MSETKHTPGPWTAYHNVQVYAEDHKGRMTVCDIRGWGHLTGGGHGALGMNHADAVLVQEANARLIAAAPDLLLIAQRVAVYLSGTENDLETDAKAAIRKATGQP